MRGKNWRDCRAQSKLNKIPSRYLATFKEKTVAKLKNVAAQVVQCPNQII